MMREHCQALPVIAWQEDLSQPAFAPPEDLTAKFGFEPEGVVAGARERLGRG